ncbi:MAG: DUF2723 domain-containing protein [Bacteroidales bacterium]|nr:DUF2723 domain-containing protein [Bacteroidales bacterium]
MELTKFKRINNIIAIAVLFVASFTYLSTIEPTVSFWDCGEFIASSYKLEVGHPPGNPVFQLIARFFTLFGDNTKAAMLVNAMSALCSAFTIFFLYLTIVHLGRRIVEKMGRSLDMGNSIAVFGAGVVGALAYCWSDTFWFSAVEAEVYAMSSLFTAVVFWAMLKWEEEADKPFANRWIVLIAFLMGISIGVHLLNLLTIPALVFIYYYKKYEVTRKRTLYVLALSGIILAVILYGIIPYVPKIAAYVDLFFVNVLGLTYNIGAALFVLALIAACFWGILYTYRKNKVLLNTILLCVTVIIIGYTSFAVVVIRSSVDTPTNENQPDNPFNLVRYLGREQYGSNPLIYGETFASVLEDIKTPEYYNVHNGKYVKVEGPAEPVYSSESKMLFPRMYTPGVGDSYVPFYEMYTEGKGRNIGGKHRKPSFGANLKYFWDYQVDFMYLRYFMWNFAGRQNDLQASYPGEMFKGNWESGIKFIDQIRLGDQSEGPDYIVNSKARNHFYFLPLILGLIGLFYQLRKDQKNWMVTMLLFVLTGIAVVVYLNQPPMQPRERDYAYAGSFYTFAIWIGLGVMWIAELLRKISSPAVASAIASVAGILVPLQMVSQTWDDHDRSGRYFVRDLGYNYLEPLGKNALIITHGDNDTFPLWYAQEVEGTRTDVRIVNTSLLGTDWYIDQMKLKMYESDPLPITIDKSQYFFGTNDFVQIYERFNRPILAKDAIDIFKNPKIKVPMSDGKDHDYLPARKLIIPVNKENVIRNGIVAEKDYDKILDSLVLHIPEGKGSLDKVELILLDILAHYNWERPIYLAQRGGDLQIGIKDYLQYDGFVYKFVPIQSVTGIQNGNLDQVDEDEMYNRVMNVYKWDNFKDTTLNIDYQHLLTFNSLVSPRDIMVQTAKALYAKGKREKALEVLDRMQELIPAATLPLNNAIISGLNDRAVIDAISIYCALGEKEKAYRLADAFAGETLKAIDLFSKPYGDGYMSYEYTNQAFSYLLLLQDVFKGNNDAAKAKEIGKLINDRFEEVKKAV